MDVSLLVALVSAVISFWTLYASHLAVAKIGLELGSEIKAYYPKDGGFAVYVPITLVNYGARLGVVSRAVLTIAPKGAPQAFVLEWGSFSRYDGANWVYEDAAHPLPVQPNGAVLKLVWFSWFPSSQPSFQLQQGEHDLEFVCWVSGKKRPVRLRRRVSVSAEDQNTLDGYRANNNAALINIRIDKRVRNMTI